MTDQPKECPCCGADADVFKHLNGSLDADRHFISCRNSDCSCQSGTFPTRGMALAAWNKRVTPAAIVLGELMAELRAKTGLLPNRFVIRLSNSRQLRG